VSLQEQTDRLQRAKGPVRVPVPRAKGEPLVLWAERDRQMIPLRSLLAQEVSRREFAVRGPTARTEEPLEVRGARESARVLPESARHPPQVLPRAVQLRQVLSALAERPAVR
jgi:hypothetical protein